ncbi:hypothetical protein KAI46_16030 [bacterium]|nr:hypothetical protein [bacterium]
MKYEIRELSQPDELKDVIRLQAIVGGLPPEDTMSPITLTALSMDRPRVGWLLGAYHKQQMISFVISLATAEPDAAYGHMLGVLPEYRDSSIGLHMLQRNYELFRRDGISRCYTTYEPLESRNAYIYLNRLGGCGIAYKKAHYYIDSGLHQGMPQDRFLVEMDVEYDLNQARESISLAEALESYPIATSENMPDAKKVLVEIPATIHPLQDQDPDLALVWRMNTRAVFEEYIDNRGLVADEFLSELVDGKRRSFYLLRSNMMPS